MNQRWHGGRRFDGPILGGALSLLLIGGAWAAEPADLARQATEALRAAQSSSFAGQAERSREDLGKAAEAIEALRQQDPANSQLRSLTQRYERQLKELDRRAGTPASPVQPTPGPTPEVPRAASGGARSASLPRDLSLQIKPLQQKMRAVEFHIRNLEDAKAGRASKSPEQVIQAMEGALPEAEQACGDFLAAAQRQGLEGHAEVQKVRRQCEDLRAQVAQAIQGGEAFVADQAAVEGALAQDRKALEGQVQRLTEILGKVNGAAIHYNDLAPVRDLLAALERFEREDLEATQRLVAELSARYGTTGDAVVAKTGSRDLWYPLERLQRLLQDLPRTRTAMADDLARRTQEMLARLSQVHDFARLERHAVVQEWAELAHRFDPEAPAVKALMASLGPALEADRQQLEQKIDRARWPEQAPNAPKDADRLGRAALEWLANDPGWGKKAGGPETPIALVVTGPWSVQGRNLVGEPIMYGLPVLVAVQRQEDRERGMARVFALTMRTEERAGVREEPPFASVTVGDSLWIRAKAVK